MYSDTHITYFVRYLFYTCPALWLSSRNFRVDIARRRLVQVSWKQRIGQASSRASQEYRCGEMDRSMDARTTPRKRIQYVHLPRETRSHKLRPYRTNVHTKFAACVVACPTCFVSGRDSAARNKRSLSRFRHLPLSSSSLSLSASRWLGPRNYNFGRIHGDNTVECILVLEPFTRLVSVLAQRVSLIILFSVEPLGPGTRDDEDRKSYGDEGSSPKPLETSFNGCFNAPTSLSRPQIVSSCLTFVFTPFDRDSDFFQNYSFIACRYSIRNVYRARKHFDIRATNVKRRNSILLV